jgi:Ca-activated chloride channel homolog
LLNRESQNPNFQSRALQLAPQQEHVMNTPNRSNLRPLTLALTLALLAGCQARQSNFPEELSKDSDHRSAEPAPVQSNQGAPQTEIYAAESKKNEQNVTPGKRDQEQVLGAITDQPAPEVDALEKIEVTSTRIRRSDAETAQPAIAANATEAARSVPQIAAAPSSPPVLADKTAELVVNTENYAATPINPIKLTQTEPVSTFSIDVDTGSYTNTRRMLSQENRLPPQDAVRPEEFINYFDYGYPQPNNRSQPFSVTTELGAAPWNPKHELLLVGLQGYSMQKSEIPPANLVFLLDVSGSMDEPNKLPLLKASMAQMVERMSARDKVSIVVYAGAAGVVLAPTPGDQHETILAALNRLSAGGSTNGGEGIELAYKLAIANKIEGGVNRILLATDGDFNVGQFSQDALKEFVSKKRESGVTLSTLGFGADNYNDAMAEQLADVGNGKYAYIDSLPEAQKVLGREIAGSLFTIASDVKIQIEFNPKVVAEYRLIGYDNRMLAREDFNNDKVDAGDIGAGHKVTALYEITRVGSEGAAIDPLRYASGAPVNASGKELGFLKLRYKLPNQSKSTLISQPIATSTSSSYRLQYAAMVAAFAEHLRGGKYLGDFDLPKIESKLGGLTQAGSESGSDLMTLIGLAKRIETPKAVTEYSKR